MPEKSVLSQRQGRSSPAFFQHRLWLLRENCMREFPPYPVLNKLKVSRKLVYPKERADVQMRLNVVPWLRVNSVGTDVQGHDDMFRKATVAEIAPVIL